MQHAGRSHTSLIETAAFLRRCRSAQLVLRALRYCPLSTPGLCVVLRRFAAPSTVRTSMRYLRLAGLVSWTGRWVRVPGGAYAKQWGAM